MTPEIFISDPTWPYSKAKTAVLTAASAVIREDGPRAATLKNIATRAGITEPAIFRHFDGVDGLFDGLFSAYERIYERSAAAFRAQGKGMAKLREASFALVGDVAASRDFAYVLLNARHVFRGYPELKARIAEHDAKDQGAILACVAEGIKAGEIRSDVDPVSVATSLIGGIQVAAAIWIESGFGFDLLEAFGDRWDDFERMVAAKSQPKPREGKAARERSAAYFPLPGRPRRGARTRPAPSPRRPRRRSRPPARRRRPGRPARESPRRRRSPRRRSPRRRSRRRRARRKVSRSPPDLQKASVPRDLRDGGLHA
jgi:TetR/AcrR family fatty acid metabolism transcriptional regulator